MSKEKNNIDLDNALSLIANKVSKLTEHEINLFFRAFFTPSELVELCNRVSIVDGLVNNKSQRKISEELGISASTVTSGSRELKFGYGKQIFEKFTRLSVVAIISITIFAQNAFARHECSSSQVFNRACPGPFGSLLDVIGCVRNNKETLLSASSQDQLCFHKTDNVFKLCPYGILEDCASDHDYEQCIYDHAAKKKMTDCLIEIAKYL